MASLTRRGLTTPQMNNGSTNVCLSSSFLLLSSSSVVLRLFLGEFRGTPWQSSLYDEFNPSKFVANWQTPHLVIHGQHDYRLDLSQGVKALFSSPVAIVGLIVRLVCFHCVAETSRPKQIPLFYNGESLGP